MNLPFSDISLSVFDEKVVSDINVFMQDFLRHGEKSQALQPIQSNKLRPILINYGTEFSRALNTVYQDKGKKFRLSDVISLDSSLIATVFRFDNKVDAAVFRKDLSDLKIENLTDNVVSAHLSVKRIIKLYPEKDTVVFIKPNQYRYWLSFIAYRDADKCFSDFTNAGY